MTYLKNITFCLETGKKFNIKILFFKTNKYKWDLLFRYYFPNKNITYFKLCLVLPSNTNIKLLITILFIYLFIYLRSSIKKKKALSMYNNDY